MSRMSTVHPRKPGLKEVAALAGVSTATVSYVLSGKRAVSAATARRVHAAIEELGYRPNRSAAALRSGRSSTIVLLIPDVTNPFYTELVVGVEERAADHDLTVVLRNANLDPSREHAYLADALSLDVAAVLCAPFTPALLTDLPAGPGARPPVVLLDEAIHGDAAARVSSDNVRGGELVAEHFASLGCARAAVVGAPEGMPTSVERIDAFRRRAAELGIEVPERAVARAVRRTGDAIAQASAIIDDVAGIDAFFAGDDVLAITLVRELRRRGLAVPDDVAVCGFDDIPWAALVTPALSTVRQRAREMGRRGVDSAMALLEGREVEDVTLPVELVVRDSTAPR